MIQAESVSTTRTAIVSTRRLAQLFPTAAEAPVTLTPRERALIWLRCWFRLTRVRLVFRFGSIFSIRTRLVRGRLRLRLAWLRLRHRQRLRAPIVRARAGELGA